METKALLNGDLELSSSSSVCSDPEDELNTASLTYDQMMELEKHYINQQGVSLCLDPDPNVGRMLNIGDYEQNKWRGWSRIRNSCEDKTEGDLGAGGDGGGATESVNEKIGGDRPNVDLFLKFVTHVKAKKGVKDVLGDKDVLKLPPIVSFWGNFMDFGWEFVFGFEDRF